jgi:DNA helicase-2/ATP-dependent DNA helicase PcrA
LERHPDGDERKENIEELLNVTAVAADVTHFLEEVALLTDLDTAPESANRINCMTLHVAKGLEFPLVFIVGLEEGLLPHFNSLNSSADLEEERRLLYVGITRAQQQLYLTYTGLRFTRGEATPRLPSRFLETLPDSVEKIELEYSD